MGNDWGLLADSEAVITGVVIAALGAVIAALVTGVPQRIWQRFDQDPKAVLRRTYRKAASAAGLSGPAKKQVLAVLQTREFFEPFAVDANVPRRSELEQFRTLLAQRDPTLPAQDVAERYYQAVYDGLSKSSLAFCRETAKRWEREMEREKAAEAARVPDSGRPAVPRNAPGYFSLVLTDDRGFADGVCAEADNFFSRLPSPLGPLTEKPLVHIAAANRDDWQLLLDAAMDEFAAFKKKSREVHLVCAAPWLWCYALGVRLQDHYDLVVYHYQAHAYHRIWQVSREIKDLKSPRHGRQYEYKVCGPPTQPHQASRGRRSDAIVLAMNIGSHLDSVLGHHEKHLRDVPMWTIRLKDDLSPGKPEDWVQAAADLAFAIDSLVEGRGDKHIYLYGVLPAVLGLMLGSAVGPYRHVHLMQFTGGTYEELLELRPRQ